MSGGAAEQLLGLVAGEPVAGAHAAHGHALDAADGRGGGLVEQAALAALVGQGADGAEVLVDRRRREFSALEHDAIALDDGRDEWAAALRNVPGEELAQGGAVAAARDVGVQAVGDDGDQRVGGRRPVGAVVARCGDGQKSCGRLSHSPVVPSSSSRVASACPAWRAVSLIRCSSTQRRSRRCPRRQGSASDGVARTNASVAAARAR